MIHQAASPRHPSASRRRITVGYVPLTDCAPLVMAQELGLFERHGLDVRLSREVGWATVREKMLHGELDAAHAPASMVVEMTCGLGVVPVPSLTGLVMAHNSNAITLSNELYDLGAHDPASLKSVVDSHRGTRRFTFAGVLKYSSQHYLMRRWLQSGGIDPDRDVDIAIVPPPLVSDCLEKGFIDGYCVAEPWSSFGLLRGIGRGVALSANLDPKHPEKIFMVLSEFEHDHPDEHRRLLAALIEAGRWCDQPANRSGLATLLAAPHYLGVPVNALKNALVGPYHLGPDRSIPATEAILFHHHGLDRPGPEKAAWILREIYQHGLGQDLSQLSAADVARLFRADIYDQALLLTSGPESAPRPLSSTTN